MQTKDKLNLWDCGKLFYIEKQETAGYKLHEIEQREIQQFRFPLTDATVRTTDKPFYPSVADAYGSLSNAQKELKHLLGRDLKIIEKQIERLEQENAIYSKPSSDKKPERVGKIRI